MTQNTITLYKIIAGKKMHDLNLRTKRKPYLIQQGTQALFWLTQKTNHTISDIHKVIKNNLVGTIKKSVTIQVAWTEHAQNIRIKNRSMNP